MPRPVKCRKVEFFPEDTYFIPLGKRKCNLKEVELKIEELEAMRLKDSEDLSQEQCAEKMGVSRQTFQIIIESARKKVTEALTKGFAIHINGGNFITNQCLYICKECGNTYIVEFNKDFLVCPECGSKEVLCKNKGRLCNHRCYK